MSQSNLMDIREQVTESRESQMICTKDSIIIDKETQPNNIKFTSSSDCNRSINQKHDNQVQKLVRSVDANPLSLQDFTSVSCTNISEQNKI